MKVTARMLADKLGDRLIETRIPEKASAGYDSIRVLLLEDDLLEAGKAYIIDGSRLESLELNDPTHLLIVTEAPVRSLPCPVLICTGTVREIYEAALAVIAVYNQLETDMIEGILEGWDIDRLLQPLAHFFQNPVQVFAPLFNTLAGARPVFDEKGTMLGTENHKPPLPAELVSNMLTSDDIQTAMIKSTAQHRQYPGFDCACYQINLIHDGKFAGRLVVIEEHGHFTPATADTLNAVAKYIGHHMFFRRSSYSTNFHIVENSVSEILSGQTTDNDYIAAVLNSISWPLRGRFNILYFTLAEQNLLTRDLSSYHINALQELMPSSIVLAMDNGIAAVFRSKNTAFESLEALLAPYLAKSGLIAGLGEPFNDFRFARTCYLQAKAATVLKTDAEKGSILKYQNSAIDHLTSSAIKSGTGAIFIHPSIRLIEAYDRENQADLLKTLRSYLEALGNQVAAAQKLHIHRNSLKYRLKRLNEIMGIDLRQTDQHLRLLMSILIYDKLNEINGNDSVR